MILDSSSEGDPARFLSLTELEARLAAMPPAPREAGSVVRILRREESGRRVPLDRVRLTPDEGVPGDAWGRKPDRKPDMQIATMQAGVAALIFNGQALELVGDELFLDLDLSAENLPEGSRLGIGDAVLVVTPVPHNGCRKFLARFGPGALEFVSKPELRHRNLRGIYLRVLEPGEIGPGDEVKVLQRAKPFDQEAPRGA